MPALARYGSKLGSLARGAGLRCLLVPRADAVSSVSGCPVFSACTRGSSVLCYFTADVGRGMCNGVCSLSLFSIENGAKDGGSKSGGAQLSSSDRQLGALVSSFPVFARFPRLLVCLFTALMDQGSVRGSGIWGGLEPMVPPSFTPLSCSLL